MIKFTSMNDSAVLAHRPEWQTAMLDELSSSEDVEKRVLRAEEELRSLMETAHPAPGYLATSIAAAMDKVHRIYWIKHVGPDGNADAMIDLLMHTVTFEEH